MVAGVVPRRLVIAALIGAVLACFTMPWLSGERTREAALAGLAGRSLDELALLAGLRDDAGEPLRDGAFEVEVIQDGGSVWITPAVERVVDGSEWFATGNSPHLLRVEVIEDPRALALQLHLWRGGWELRSPEPLRVRTTPWVIVMAGLLGAIAALLVRRASLGLAVAGATAQMLLVVIAPPDELFAPQTTWAEWQSGPLLGRLLPAVETMTPFGLALAAAVITSCLILVWFDHKRSRGGEASLDLPSASLFAVLGSLGLIALLEAVFRSGFAASATHAVGWLAVLGLVGAWIPALWLALEQWRRQRPSLVAVKGSLGDVAS